MPICRHASLSDAILHRAGVDPPDTACAHDHPASAPSFRQIPPSPTPHPGLDYFLIYLNPALLLDPPPVPLSLQSLRQEGGNLAFV